jgi:tetratricopeptide (TPR) repeat protein
MIVPTQHGRHIRVFVSSTFRDMKAEREELAKRIFPILRKRCEARGVVWGDVDLRWGIPAEAVAEGKVLPICLEEIRRCRPYFIGVLGERYGWVPSEIPDGLVEAQPWLAEHRERSVTELEILHGVLNDPGMAGHAFFYFRDPAYVDRLPAGVGREDFRSESPEAAAKLIALKERIRASGLALREGYAHPKAFGELVLADLGAVIDRLFPEGSQPDALEREAWEHEAFARTRAVVEVRPGEAAGVYVGRREYFERLDAHAAGGGPPVVVLGESGSGKSALLANWTLTYRGRHPEVQLLAHFIGATPASTDWMAMLRRILAELNRKLGLGIEIPDKPDALRATFANALHMAAARGRVILILDALDQLEDRDQAPDLVWLPPAIPEGVRLIVSALPGRSLDHLGRRRWPVITVQPLGMGERRDLIEKYLRQYRKELSEVRAERVASSRQTANPLYLRALLEELRLWGAHETLDECISGYLSAATVEELYERILARYEGDYEGERPGLVRDAMTLLWAARRGLSEAELLDLLGHEGAPLPRAYWSPLHLAAETSLVNRSGLIGFFHDYLRRAVERRYLPTEEDRRQAHLRLAGYFGRQELEARKIDELPWQLAQAEDWQALLRCVTDIRAFKVNYDATANFRDWLRYCAALENRYDLEGAFGTAVRAYEADCDVTRESLDNLQNLGLFLGTAVSIEEGVSVLKRALNLRERTFGSSDPSLVDHLRAIANLYQDHRALWRAAESYLRRALTVSEECFGPCHSKTAGTLNDLGTLLVAKKDFEAAATYLHRALSIWEKDLGRRHAVTATIINNLALLAFGAGDTDEAERLFREALSIREERLAATDTELARSLENLGVLLASKGKTFEATSSLLRAERIYATTFGPAHTYARRVHRKIERILQGRRSLQ